jgi:hypothetical protein
MRADRPNFGPGSSASHAIHVRFHSLAPRSCLAADRMAGTQLAITEESARMLRSLNRPNIVAAWVGVLLGVAGAAALSGVSITPGNSALWFAVCVVPPVVMLMVWSGAPPPAMQEILYAVDRRD